jgi:Na+/melibiose symporter-like transporter
MVPTAEPQPALAMNPQRRESTGRLWFGELAGLTIIVLFPTVVWIGVLALGSSLFGWALTGWVYGIVATMISGFLLCIWASFAGLKDHD